MKKLRNLIAVMAAMSMAVVFTGCGDDDDDDDDNGGNPQGPQIFAPGTLAELTAQNKIYTVNVAGEPPITLRFPAAGQYEIVQDNVTQTGTISGASLVENTWTLTATPAAGQQGAEEGVLRLLFTANNAGTWTFTPNGGQAESGTFTVTTGPVNGTNGNTTGNPPGPDDLTGQTLQLSYQPSGGEKFQFTTATVLSYENGANAGTYTYSQANRRINATLDNGSTYEITLNDATNATVVFNGGAAEAATYTLQ